MPYGAELRVLFHVDAPMPIRRELAVALAGADVTWCAEDDEARLAEVLPDVDVWWHVLRPIGTTDIERAPRLRLIHKFGAGVDTIDRDATQRRGISVCNMPGSNAPAVAEATVALMLAVLRRVPHYDELTRRGAGWPLDIAMLGSTGELGARTVGLVGYGAVARRVEAITRAFGATVLHTSRSDDASATWRPLDQLLHEADVVSVHVSLTSETRQLLDRDALSSMRPGAVVVNTSRGAVLDEAALVDALRSGRLRGAGLDVFASEPLGAGNELIGLPNVVLQPHVAWLTPETMARCVERAVANLGRLEAGQPLQDTVWSATG